MLKINKRTFVHEVRHFLNKHPKSLPSRAIFSLQTRASLKVPEIFKDLELPNIINIETNADCNNNCSFCPHSTLPREKEYMSQEVFKTLVDKIIESGFKGQIMLNINNEPLLDRNLIDNIKYFRSQGFEGVIGFFSNGLILTEDIAYDLFDAGLSYLNVDMYSDDGKKLVGRAKKWLLDTESKVYRDFPDRDVNLHYRLKHEILDNRGDDAPNKLNHVEGVRQASCIYPFESLNFTYDGSAILCCYDFYTKQKFAHINDMSIKEIWDHKFLKKVREGLKTGDRSVNPLCKVCDFRGYQQANTTWYTKLFRI